MKPEKRESGDTPGKFREAGIPEEWIEVVRKLGFPTVASLREAKPGKLFNDLCGYNKKNKLGLQNPSPEEVSNWLK